ncbi:MAG TPA: hypothetical protein P5572_16170 [Phycisphaerae bacterium]|nr:hypothetical protein [Phycisphaerae bacterium]
MKTQAMKCLVGVAVAALLAVAVPAQATVTVTVDPGLTWIGYMNVFNLPAPDGDGAFVFGQPWGVADLTAVFSGPTLSLGAAPINDPNEFWYVGTGNPGGPGVPGNKSMDANMYVEDDTLVGETVTFQGVVTSNTLDSEYTSVAFIKDFAPDYSTFNVATFPLAPGPFSVSLATDPTSGRHVQFGFETVGRNVWPTDAASKGYVNVIAPEPTTLVLCLSCVGVVALRRRR